MIISSAALVASPDYQLVNALMCVSVRGDYQLKLRDVRLDHSDGLDWETVVRCHYIHLLKKEDFTQRRGLVTHKRRRQIVRKISENFGFAGL